MRVAVFTLANSPEDSASISTKMLQELGGGTLVGPYLVGFKESIQIAPLGANVADIVNLAALSAFKS